MGLVSDAVVLAKAGFGKTSAALDLVEKLHAEEECEWNTVLRVVSQSRGNYFLQIWYGDPYRGLLRISACYFGSTPTKCESSTLPSRTYVNLTWKIL